MPQKTVRERLAGWWQGKWVEFDRDPDDSLVIIPNGYYKRPWIAAPAEAMLRWTVRNGWQIVGTLISLVGLYLAWKALA